jgi:hypothetical protein
VFSGDVSMSSFDKTTKAAEMQLQSNAALLSSGILDRTFNFSVLATSLSYEATDKAPSIGRINALLHHAHDHWKAV